ncbi:MAG: EF-hand domain-containing protein [Pseudobdellovibrionaceae bacterium]|jgi:Ca2+-binding EF-hand superfamily protein|nr:EF-hand domain-containing protein [Pseudobdellovibrionaceae bacterium]
MNTKSKLLAFSALALLLTSGFPAMAQDDTPPPPMGDERPYDMNDRPGKGPQGDRPYGDPDKMAERQAEMQKRGAEMFAKADTNKDGFLTKQEMLEAHKTKLDEMFEKADTDKDGKLSPEEMKKGRDIMREKFREKFKDRFQNMKDKGEEGQMSDKKAEWREKMKERNSTPDAPATSE